jgi:REP element-mobilizing transposase RayT
MARRPRVDPAGGTHHVFTRGTGRVAVAVDAEDNERNVRLLDTTVSRFMLRCHAWCYLPNHMHLLVSSPLGNLSKAMQWYGTCAAQTFNLRHERVGHLFQGRFGSRLVEDEAYFLELTRYIVINPVRAGLCASPGDWAWSSYRATAGLRAAPRYLDREEILRALGTSGRYVDWVAGGMLSDALDEGGAPRRPALSALIPVDSDEALACAHFRHGFTITEIARHLGTSRSRISRRLAGLPASARLGSDPNRAGGGRQ